MSFTPIISHHAQLQTLHQQSCKSNLILHDDALCTEARDSVEELTLFCYVSLDAMYILLLHLETRISCIVLWGILKKKKTAFKYTSIETQDIKACSLPSKNFELGSWVAVSWYEYLWNTPYISQTKLIFYDLLQNLHKAINYNYFEWIYS